MLTPMSTWDISCQHGIFFKRPWVEKGKNVDRHWDYSSTWLKGIENIGTKAKNDKEYFPIDKKLVFETFCDLEPPRVNFLKILESQHQNQ